MLDEIERALPDRGLFRDYMDLTTGGEVCPRYRFFSFAAILGAVISRNVVLRRSSKLLSPLYPNLWVLLIGPQGVGHKSSAMSMAKRMLDKVPKKLRPRWLAAKLTPEALVAGLSTPDMSTKDMRELVKTAGSEEFFMKKAQGILYSSEFGVLMGKEKYNQGMIALLTDLYDCPDEWRADTIMRGDNQLLEVCLSICGASTPDWMQSMLPSDAFKGGFMSRMLLVAYPKRWSVRCAEPPEIDEELLEKVQKQVADVAVHVKGTMSWEGETKEYFVDWYNNMDNKYTGQKAAYLERKQDHLLRLAMLINISYGYGTDFKVESLQRSREILDAIEPDTMDIIDYIMTEPRMRTALRILEECKNGKREHELLRSVWPNLGRPGEFYEMVHMLIKTKQLKMATENGEVVYRTNEEEE